MQPCMKAKPPKTYLLRKGWTDSVFLAPSWSGMVLAKTFQIQKYGKNKVRLQISNILTSEVEGMSPFQNPIAAKPLEANSEAASDT